jgi:hypothetical protein
MLKLAPTASYQITLPEDILQKHDEDGVSSFWRPGSHCALQLSSYTRDAGPQVSAEQRLRERMERSGSKWMRLQEFHSKGSQDFAAGSILNEDGWLWTHIYLVWPDLAIYATISNPPYEEKDSARWAVDAVEKIERLIR